MWGRRSSWPFMSSMKWPLYACSAKADQKGCHCKETTAEPGGPIRHIDHECGLVISHLLSTVFSLRIEKGTRRWGGELVWGGTQFDDVPAAHWEGCSCRGPPSRWNLSIAANSASSFLWKIKMMASPSQRVGASCQGPVDRRRGGKRLVSMDLEAVNDVDHHCTGPTLLGRFGWGLESSQFHFTVER